MVAPSRRLENVDEALCLTAWRNGEVEEAGRMALYMRSKRRVSKISRTMSMTARVVSNRGRLMESPRPAGELESDSS